jgi:pimeloyl-ACP methyl ester carboxylesterase
MPTVELAAGTIEYPDTGGGGPVVVLLHGLAMNGSLWRHVVRELGGDHRCVVSTLPLGGHRRPMRADADLSPRGIGRFEAQFLEALDLRDVTLVGNDSGLFLFAAVQCAGRISRLVVTSCEAFENFPPRLPGRAVALAGRLPGGLNALVQPSRLRMLRRLPVVLGWMAKRPVPDDAASRRPPAHARGRQPRERRHRRPGLPGAHHPGREVRLHARGSDQQLSTGRPTIAGKKSPELEEVVMIAA